MITTAPVPGSKSITHRALLLAACADAPCLVEGGLHSDDTDATLEGLYRMGYDITDDGTTYRARPAESTEPEDIIDCGNSGSTLRLLAAHAAVHPWTTRFDGDASLRQRPVDPLLEALQGAGAVIKNKGVPCSVTGPMHSGDFEVDGSVSSQFTSALLLAFPFMDGPSTLRVTGPLVSRPYVDLTIQVMQHFGIMVERNDDGTFVVEGGQRPHAATVKVPPDWSTAAFYLVAGALTDGAYIPHLRTGTGQPDEAIIPILSRFGLQVAEDDNGVTVYPGPIESPGEVDLRDHPDLFAPLAVLAACAEGTTTFTGGTHLRRKESDRIQAMVEGLARMGINAHPRPDGMRVPGGPLHGAPIHCFDDHRIHMAFQVAALAADGPVKVDGAHVVNVSHPEFHNGIRRFWQEKT